MNSMTSNYEDARTELEAQLFTDVEVGEPEDAYYRRLPAPDPDYPEVLVHNEHTNWGSSQWHVACDVGILDADVDEIAGLIAALTVAERQARIMNAPGRVISIPRPPFASRVSEQLKDHPIGSLTSSTDSEGEVAYSFDPAESYSDLPVGDRWGDEDGRYSFEYLGEFQYLGEEIRDGRSYAFFAEIESTATEEKFAVHTDYEEDA